MPGGCSRLRGSAGVMPHGVWVPGWGPYLGTSEAVTQLKLLKGDCSLDLEQLGLPGGGSGGLACGK